MATLTIGMYRRWLGPVPEDSSGKQLPKSLWSTKRNHNWLVRWVGTTGKKYGKVFKTKKEAQLFKLEMQSKLLSGQTDKPRKITLYSFRLEHEKVIKGQVSYGTYQEHKRSLELFEKFIGSSIELSKITPGNAEAFVADRLASKEVCVATVNKYIRNLRSIFNKAIDPRGYISQGQNPFTKIKPRKTTDNAKRYVSIKEYRKLLEATDDSWWKTFMAVAYSSGLRLNEILNLTWKDIDFDNQRVNVTAKKATDKIIKWEPKGRKNRIVPISDEAIKLLVDLQVNAPDEHSYIFISPQRLECIAGRIQIGKWNERSEIINNINRSFDDIRTKACVEKCTIHDLRRSAITNWAQKLPFHVIHKLAGHSNIKTTMDYYLAVRPEDFKAAGEVFGEILEKAKLD
jgi:integrase